MALKGVEILDDNLLLVCIDCFNSSIKIPTSGSSSNVREREEQEM